MSGPGRSGSTSGGRRPLETGGPVDCLSAPSLASLSSRRRAAPGVVVSTKDQGFAAARAELTEYLAGHWVRRSSAWLLTSAQWSVIDAYASFSSEPSRSTRLTR